MSTRFDPPERGPLGPEVTTVVAAPIVPPASESAVSWGQSSLAPPPPLHSPSSC